jgi:hypothetical protein
MVESKFNRNNNQMEVKYVPFKSHSEPLEIKTYNRFDKDNIFNIYPFQNLNASKSKEELNADLPINVADISGRRLKTSQATHRNGSPEIHPEQKVLERVSTSSHGFRNQNKYYTLIEEAMKMSTRFMTSSGGSKVTQFSG